MFVRTTVAHPRYEFLAGRLEGADVGLSPLVAARACWCGISGALSALAAHAVPVEDAAQLGCSH